MQRDLPLASQFCLGDQFSDSKEENQQQGQASRSWWSKHLQIKRDKQFFNSAKDQM
jgi:hypothetical protein